MPVKLVEEVAYSKSKITIRKIVPEKQAMEPLYFLSSRFRETELGWEIPSKPNRVPLVRPKGFLS